MAPTGTITNPHVLTLNVEENRATVNDIARMEKAIFQLKALRKKHGGIPRPTNSSAKNLSPTRFEKRRKKRKNGRK